MRHKEPWFYGRQFLKDKKMYISGNVIDVGAGTLKYKNFILSINKVKSYTALDFYKFEGVDIVANLNDHLDLQNDQFDTAVCISVIEHLYEPQIALNEIFRILKPGGYLLLTAPWVYPYHREPNDFFRYSRYALDYMMKKSGFEVISIGPTGGNGRTFMVFLERWMPYIGPIMRYFENNINNPKIEDYESDKYLTTPSHHVVARKS